MVRSSCGEALLRLRISQPASRQCCRRLVDQRGRGAIVGRVVGQFHPVDPAHQAAGLQQSGGAQRRFADQESRAEADAAGQLVRFGIDDAADLEGRAADVTRSPSLRSSRASRVESTAAPNGAVALGQQIRHRQLRIERQFAEHRIGAIDRLDLDQSQPAVAGARHRAQRRRDRELSARAQKGDFVRLGFALDQGERDVAAEQRAALARQSLAEAGGDRADAGDRHHAERDAGDEDVEAAQAAAQFAQGKAQRQRRARGRARTVSAAMVMKRLCDRPPRCRSGPSAAAPRGRSAAPARCHG